MLQSNSYRMKRRLAKNVIIPDEHKPCSLETKWAVYRPGLPSHTRTTSKYQALKGSPAKEKRLGEEKERDSSNCARRRDGGLSLPIRFPAPISVKIAPFAVRAADGRMDECILRSWKHQRAAKMLSRHENTVKVSMPHENQVKFWRHGNDRRGWLLLDFPFLRTIVLPVKTLLQWIHQTTLTDWIIYWSRYDQ